MPSMVLVGNLGSRWGPPGAFGGPQTGSNTCAEHERKRAIKRKRTVQKRVRGRTGSTPGAPGEPPHGLRRRR